MLGLVLLVASDHHDPQARAPRPLLGDALVLLGASLYAVSNVSQEKLLAGVTERQGRRSPFPAAA